MNRVAMPVILAAHMIWIPDKGSKFIPVAGSYSQINGGRYQVFRPEILFPKPPKKLTGTYELTSLRMQATPGVVQMGQILDSVYRPLKRSGTLEQFL